MDTVTKTYDASNAQSANEVVITKVITKEVVTEVRKTVNDLLSEKEMVERNISNFETMLSRERAKITAIDAEIAELLPEAEAQFATEVAKREEVK